LPLQEHLVHGICIPPQPRWSNLPAQEHLVHGICIPPQPLWSNLRAQEHLVQKYLYTTSTKVVAPTAAGTVVQHYIPPEPEGRPHRSRDHCSELYTP